MGLSFSSRGVCIIKCDAAPCGCERLGVHVPYGWLEATLECPYPAQQVARGGAELLFVSKVLGCDLLDLISWPALVGTNIR